MASVRLVTSGSIQSNKPNSQPNSRPRSGPLRRAAERGSAVADAAGDLLDRVELAADDGDALHREPAVGEEVDRPLGVPVGGERGDRPSRLRRLGLSAAHTVAARSFGHRVPPVVDVPTGWGWLGWAVIWTRRGLACSATGMVIVSTPSS